MGRQRRGGELLMTCDSVDGASSDLIFPKRRVAPPNDRDTTSEKKGV